MEGGAVTYLETLTTARDALALRLSVLATQPQTPDYSLDGQSFSSDNSELERVMQALAELDQLIRAAEGPVSVASRGRY